MSLVEIYGPYIPYLRRFARALTGSQTSGDTYVRTALEALAAGDTNIDTDLHPKIALYRMFLGIWSTTGAQLEAKQDVAGSTAAQRVSKLAPVSRQAFLLQSLEGLTLEDTALVMKTTPDDASEMIKEAEADIEKELRTNVLIIEDEPIIAADIEGLVLELGHTVDSISATRSDAVRNAKLKSPGLVLADVHLADGSSGIDAVEDILAEYDVPVIFITAFPERLLTGDKPEPAYLVSKPFDPDNVKAAISQALFFHSR